MAKGLSPKVKTHAEAPTFGQFVWERLLSEKIGAVLIGTIFVITFVAIVLLWVKRYPTAWWDWLSLLLTVFTLGTAIYVLYTQWRREWEDYLPNRLTVRFRYEEREVMRCEKAYLASESDIRALAQQIGMQMANNTPLKFKAPLVIFSPPQLHKKERYILYEATIHLLELPPNCSLGKTLVWREPFGDIETIGEEPPPSE